MPTYGYACRDCGERLEVVQRFADEPLRICPICGGELRKLYFPTGIVFKGAGFYKTDSRTGAAARSSGDGKAAATGKKETPKPSEGSSSPGSSTPSGEGAGSKPAAKETA